MTDDVKVKIDDTNEVQFRTGEKIDSILKQAKPSVLRRSARLTQIEEDERNERYEAKLPKQLKTDLPTLKMNLADNSTLSIEDIERLKKNMQKPPNIKNCGI